MSSIHEITVDESVFLTPKATCSLDELEEYTGNLIKLRDFLSQGKVSIFMTDEAYYSLSTKKCYSLVRLKRFFERQKKFKCSTKDIMTTVSYIRSRILSFQESYDIDGVLVDGEIKLTPTIGNIASTNKRVRELSQSILMIAVLRKSSRKDEGHLLALVSDSIWKIDVEAKIVYIKSNGSKDYDFLYLPNVFVGEVQVISDLSFLELMQGALDLYDNESGGKTGPSMKDIAFR